MTTTQPTPDCPPWCTHHRDDELEHFGNLPGDFWVSTGTHDDDTSYLTAVAQHPWGDTEVNGANAAEVVVNLRQVANEALAAAEWLATHQ